MRRKNVTNKRLTGLLKTKKCAVCGKVFCRLSYENYVFKHRDKFFCGYSCMQEARRRGMLKQPKIVKL